MFDYVLALMAAIHPTAPNTYDARTVARAIAEVAAAEEPLPGMTRERTMAVLTVTAWQESRFLMRAVGDNGIAFCAMQIHGYRSLLNDPIACVRSAVTLLRKTMPTCKAAPLAPYIGGCGVWVARRMSQARLAQAERIEEKANVARAAAEEAARAAASSSSGSSTEGSSATTQ